MSRSPTQMYQRRSEVKYTTQTITVLGALMIATSVSAQRQWTITGQTVPELVAVDQMMQNIMNVTDFQVGCTSHHCAT